VSRAAEASVLGRRGLPLAGARRRARPAPWLASFAFSRQRAVLPFPDAPAEIVEPQWLIENVALDEPSPKEPPPERASPEDPPMTGAAGAARVPAQERVAAPSRRTEQPQAAPPAAPGPAARPSADAKPVTPVAPDEERTASSPSPRTEAPPGRVGRPSPPVLAKRSSPGSAASDTTPSRRPMQLDEPVAERGAGAPPAAAAALPGRAPAPTMAPPSVEEESAAPPSVEAQSAAPVPPIRTPVSTPVPGSSMYSTMLMGAPPAAPTRKAAVSTSTAGAAAGHRERVEAPTTAPEPPRGVRIGTVQVLIRSDPVRAGAAAPAPLPNAKAPARAPAARPFRSPWISWRRGD
jgi:hypothetical protein